MSNNANNLSISTHLDKEKMLTSCMIISLITYRL